MVFIVVYFTMRVYDLIFERKEQNKNQTAFMYEHKVSA